MKRKPAKQKRRVIWVAQYENGVLDRMWHIERPSKIEGQRWRWNKIIKFIEA